MHWISAGPFSQMTTFNKHQSNIFFRPPFAVNVHENTLFVAWHKKANFSTELLCILPVCTKHRPVTFLWGLTLLPEIIKFPSPLELQENLFNQAGLLPLLLELSHSEFPAPVSKSWFLKTQQHSWNPKSLRADSQGTQLNSPLNSLNLLS